MPKRVFWPLTLLVMGVIIFSTYLGILPSQLTPFWPLVLITVALGGLFLSDREDWVLDEPVTTEKKKRTAKKPAQKAAKKTAKKTTKKSTNKSTKKTTRAKKK